MSCPFELELESIRTLNPLSSFRLKQLGCKIERHFFAPRNWKQFSKYIEASESTVGVRLRYDGDVLEFKPNLWS